jgi:Tetratricopeptide repeat
VAERLRVREIGDDEGHRLLRIAGVLGDLGQLEQARPLAERALAIDEAAYGPDHSTAATIRANLTLILRQLRNEDR